MNPPNPFILRLAVCAALSVSVGFAAAHAQAEEPLQLDAFGPPQIVELHAKLPHVQGIETDGATAWITSVEKAAGKGWLHVFDLATGKPRRQSEIQDGDMIHPGGLSSDGDALWIPVAGYTPVGPSSIQRRDKTTLDLLFAFPVSDHIGCVAADGERLIGGNWDSKELYVWDKKGALIEKRKNPAGGTYQDMKIVDGWLVASGGLGKTGGAIDWIRLPSFEPDRRVLAGRTDRGASLTREGMALREGRLFLLPEDGASRVFIYKGIEPPPAR